MCTKNTMNIFIKFYQKLTFKYVFYILEIDIPSFQRSRRSDCHLESKEVKTKSQNKCDCNQTIICELLTENLVKTGWQKIILIIVLGQR